jgi:type I restriction enzyme S subunit
MSWTKTKISEFLFERKGRYKPQDEDIQGLQRIEKIDFKGNFHIGSKSSKTDMILVKKGDLVISGINVAKGAMGIYTEEDDVVATIHYSSYTFDKSKINVDYFKRFLKSPEFLKLIDEQVKGGIKTEIKPKHILPLEINLPDIDTQNNIVSNFEKIEDDMTILDNEIENQQNLLTKLKQSILQEAIEGKLTSKWREQNQDIEPASVLLEKIQVEKEQLVKEKKIKKSKPLAEISEDEIPFEIPDNWIFCRFGKITNAVRGGSPRPAGDPKFYNGDIPFLKVADLTNDDCMYVQKYTYSIKEAGLHKTRYINDETLLLTNSGATLGIPKISSFPTAFNDGIAAFIYMNEELHKPYFYYLLKSKTQWFLKEASRGQGQPNLNTDIIGDTIIALPPFEEQKEIVQKIEKLLKTFDELEEQINSSKQNTQTLMQAVLKEAFEN